MSVRSSSLFDFGALVMARFRALNYDLSAPSPTRTVGGAGPFDFSGAVSDSAVTIKWKIDNGNEVSDTVDLSAVGDIEAVTVDELVTACTAASLTGITASKESVTNFFKLAMTTPGSTKSISFYGEVAQFSKIGQGLGTKWILSDTLQSIADEPNVKADETKTITDSNAIDTEVIVPGYRKGTQLTVIDTARDDALRQLMEGGTYDSATGQYTVPTLNSTKYYFEAEFYYPAYLQGTNLKGDIEAYRKDYLRIGTGAVSGKTLQNDFAPVQYVITATSYKDPTTSVVSGDTVQTKLTVAAYSALDLYNT